VQWEGGGMSDYILELKDISKEFPGVRALNRVNLKVRKGEVHGLCGENGAGKSTIIKILSGVYPHGTFDGEIVIDGVPRVFGGTTDAERAGVVCIHQELALVNELTVQENIFLGNEPTRMGLIDWNELYRKTKELLDRLDLKIDPTDKVKDLGVGQQQLVEIAKALSKNAKILILDEPTSALTEHEVEILLGIVRKLKQNGVTCIYISHKLNEIYEICDTVSVLRDGQYIGTKPIGELKRDELIYMMVGRNLEMLFPREPHERKELSLEVRNFTVYDALNPNRKRVDGVSFKAYRGEILGISGLIGSGRTELVSAIFGAYPGRKDGEVYIDGVRANIRSPVDAVRMGLALVSEDRKKFGLVLDMSVANNITLSSLDKLAKFLLRSDVEIIHAQKYISQLRVKTASTEVPVKNLSGGNQQKVVIGKWLMTDPKILILDEPTRGIDVGAKTEIYRIMNDLVRAGVTVIMVSSELEEILGISDRILVMSEGRIMAELDYREATQEKIMHFATGGH